MDVTPETATRSRDGVSVRRRLEPAAAGVVATVVVRATTPTRVRIVDDLPGGLPVEGVAFADESAPDGGRAAPERVEATVAVTDATARFNYRLALSAAPGTVRIDPPTIDAVVRLDGDGTPGLGPAETGADDRDAVASDDQHDDDPATVTAVEGRLDDIAERVDRLAAGLDASDEEMLDSELSALEADLDAVAGALELVRDDEPTVAERLADIERYRLSVATPAADGPEGDRSAVAPDASRQSRTEESPRD